MEEKEEELKEVFCKSVEIWRIHEISVNASIGALCLAFLASVRDSLPHGILPMHLFNGPTSPLNLDSMHFLAASYVKSYAKPARQTAPVNAFTE